MSDVCECENCRLGRDGPARIVELEAQLAAARRLLKKVEWLDGTDGYQRCPECEGIDPSHGLKLGGHTPDCALAKALEGT